MRLLQCWFVLFFTLFCSGVKAHEIRPAYLQMQQTTESSYHLLWRVPIKGDKVIKLVPVFSDEFTLKESGVRKLMSGSLVIQYELHAPRPIQGTTLAIANQEKTMVDVLISIEYLNGEKLTLMLKPDNPEIRLPEKTTKWQVAKTYTVLGIEHILLGFDHLLFVLALLILSVGFKKLVKTITAFTVAHSITLSCSVMGWVKLPGPPVEAVIALSIVFLALEIVKVQQGQPSLTSQKPWLVAFIFGLLHGFGFAGALTDIGLPQTEMFLALATFNIGVELGQLIFVVAVIVLFKVIKSFLSPKEWGKKLLPYSIGSIAVFWTIERLMSF
ncbi:HupE / UreJ protein [Vibrio sp. B1FLJ16]|nr:HupE / UreJ protein [Vibrio sp. B1FLJ16]CAE6893506.1 HupE / UreJ protein [Vibrio sp. B1FLJ16]